MVFHSNLSIGSAFFNHVNAFLGVACRFNLLFLLILGNEIYFYIDTTHDPFSLPNEGCIFGVWYMAKIN